MSQIDNRMPPMYIVLHALGIVLAWGSLLGAFLFLIATIHGLDGAPPMLLKALLHAGLPCLAGFALLRQVHVMRRRQAQAATPEQA